MSMRFGAAAARDSPYRRMTYVLDPRLLVLACVPFEQLPAEHAALVLRFLASLPAARARTPGERHLVVRYGAAESGRSGPTATTPRRCWAAR